MKCLFASKACRAESVETYSHSVPNELFLLLFGHYWDLLKDVIIYFFPQTHEHLLFFPEPAFQMFLRLFAANSMTPSAESSGSFVDVE